MPPWDRYAQQQPTQQAPQPTPAPSYPGVIRGPAPTPDPVSPRDIQADNRAEIGQQSDISNTNFDNMRSLASDFNGLQAVKDYNTVIRQLSSALTTDPTPSGDQSLIVSYARMLDPSSVVREAEFDITAQADSALGRTVTRLQRELGIEGGGRLSPEARSRVISEMINLAVNYRRGYEGARADYTSRAERFGFNPLDVVGEDAGIPFHQQMRAYDERRRAAREGDQSGGGAMGAQDNAGEFNGTGDPNEPDPGSETDEYGTPLRLRNGETLQGYRRDESGRLIPQYGRPQPTRDGLSALILGDGTIPLGEQIAAGAGDVVQGMGDVLGLLGNPVNASINAITGSNLSTDLGQTARDVSGLPDSPNPLISAVNRGAASGLMTAGLAGAGAPLATGAGRAALSQMGRTPIRDTMAGAGAGAGAYAGQDYGPAGQIAGALGGALGGSMVSGIPGGIGAMRNALAAPPPAAQRELIESGAREGVRVMTTDALPPQTQVGRLGQGLGERIPYAGTGGARAAQQVEREQVARNIALEYGVTGDDDFLAGVSADLTRTRGRTLQGLTNRKNRIIDGIPGQVEAPQAVAAIDQQIAELEGINAERFAPVISQLRSFRRVLTSGRTLREVEENRRLLGDMFADDGLANIRQRGEQAIRRVYGPLRDDMTNFIRANAGDEVAARFTRTNDRLADMVGELEATNFRRTLNMADATPESVSSLLFSNKESDVRRLVENLSPRGRRMAQSAIIHRAISSAGDLRAVSGLSPQQFANAIERYATNIGVVFSPEDTARLIGAQRLLQATQRASVAAATPPTGIQNNLPIVAAILTDWLGGAGAAMTTGAVGGLIARSYESPMVRDLLLGLGRAEVGSARETRTIERIMRVISSQPTFREAFVAANDNPSLVGNVAAGEDQQQ